MLTRKGQMTFVAGAVAALISALAILEYFKAIPWVEPNVSPGKQFEIRSYEGFSPQKYRGTTPGNGSDNIDGYIALVDRKSNKELKRKRVQFLVTCVPNWTDDEVIFAGEVDTIWKLPRKDFP